MRNGITAVLAIAAALIGCKSDEPLTNEEAKQALEESSVDSQAAALTSASIEVSSEFTIGQAAEAAAGQIRDFIQSQMKCAKVTLESATLTLEYGVNPGSCTFRGLTFEGTQTIHVEKNQHGDVEVTHTWKDFNNGVVSVTGNAKVTWSTQDAIGPSRRVMHQLTWTRMSDGHSGVGSGDRTQRPLDGGLVEGFEVDGTRSWTGSAGRWELDIDHIEMRWVDPIPQAGSWVLQTPFDKTITLAFERIDAERIGVSVSDGSRSVEFQVNKLGLASPKE